MSYVNVTGIETPCGIMETSTTNVCSLIKILHAHFAKQMKSNLFDLLRKGNLFILVLFGSISINVLLTGGLNGIVAS